jgi:carboxyl-terminal processing protease
MDLRSSMRKTIPVLLLAAMLSAGALRPAAAAVPPVGQIAPATPAPGSASLAAAEAPSVVLAAVATLARWHIASPSPVRLLEEAVSGLRRALAKAGVEEDLGSLSRVTDEEAVAAFQRRFEEARAAAAGRLSDEQLEHEVVRAMARMLDDSHTGFLAPNVYRERILRQQNAASYSGIGVLTMRRGGDLYVTRVFPGGPADAAGLRDFDRIIAVDGEPVSSGFEPPLRGAEGTPVDVTVRRNGVSEPLVLSVVRSRVVAPTVEYAMRAHDVGYLRLYGFTRGSAADVRAGLEALVARRMRALVLDLRGNGGGFVAELNRIADMLLPSGTELYTTSSRRDGRVTQRTGDVGPVVDPAIPLVVLLDRGTGSAAEMLSAALGESGRARLVGVRSAGAVLVSITVALPGGAGLSVSIADVTTAAGTVLERVGVRPGTDVDYDAADLERGVDTQVQFALDLGARLAGAIPAATR